MTIRYKCKNCGALLYECREPDYRGVLTPHEVAFMYNFACPVCKSPLNPDTRNPDWREHIVVKPAEHGKRKKHIRNNRARSHKTRSKGAKGARFITSTEFIIEEL